MNSCLNRLLIWLKRLVIMQK